MAKDIKIDDKVRIVGDGAFAGDVGKVFKILEEGNCFMVEVPTDGGMHVWLPFWAAEVEKV